MQKLILTKMKNLNNANGIKKVTEKSKFVANVINENLSDAILSKLDKISTDALNTKTILNRSVWKIEVLKNYKSEKTARRILRSKQFELSSKVVNIAKTKIGSLADACNELEMFYFDNLVTRNKFSNIDSDKVKGQIIYLASEISLSTK